ncbi:MAG: sigma-70 family RNA polymerase sigma factor [Ruminococcus sp.]|nr:sigma-70 family RNA polymerase sigma factor [Ruminococcus sp.]
MKKRIYAQLQKNSERTIEKLISDYSGYVYTIFFNMVGGYCTEEDLEEMTSDVFIKLWQNLDILDKSRPVSPYLAAIARNLAKNKLRSINAKPDFCEFEDILAADTDIVRSVEWLEDMSLLHSSLDMLSSLEQQLIVRYYFYGEPLNSLSKRFSISDTNAKTKLYRARKKLKVFLTERGFKNET